MSTGPGPGHIPQGYSSLYKHIAYVPELGLFRRFGAYWAKRVHDDTSELLACITRLNNQLGNIPELDAKTVLDCPLRVVKEKCPKLQWGPLYEAWEAYDEALVRYGDTLCRSEQIMKLPNQKMFNTRQLADFKPPISKPIFENDASGNLRFVPTGESADTYQGDPDRMDTCAWRTIPRRDFLTMRFIYFSPWIERNVLSRLRNITKRQKTSHSDGPKDMRYDRIVGLMDLITCLLTSILLTTTVVILALVRPLIIRIVIVGVFGALFALLLKLMAGDPTRGEVFGATAAFYAVAVVFVGSTNNSCACR